jgi:SAM-dependent methyltransferase
MSLLLFEQDWRDVWDGAAPTEPVGAVFTKPEVTEFILDLAGYRPLSGRLADRRLLEPSCGDGAFLGAAVRRLLASERKHRGEVVWDDTQLAAALKACDVNIGFVTLARERIIRLLVADGCPAERANTLSAGWVEHADFLLANWRERFDFVIGNPPYVRIEDLPQGVLGRYRELFPTCVDRADLYIAFFEQGLRLLSPDGQLAFICANRFAKNQYGRSLRELIARQYRVRYFLNLEHTQPFVTDVSAYPCIVVIDRRVDKATRAASLDSVDAPVLRDMLEDESTAWSVFPLWYPGGVPWVATSKHVFDQHAALAERHPLLEESAEQTRVGIGVATGADDVFVRPAKEPSVEEHCQLPLVVAKDVSAESLNWSGHYLINPYTASSEGGFNSLKENPGLAAYFEQHREHLEKRHTARKNPETWYRTIDRVAYGLTGTPKLLLPDIQSGGVVGWDEGKYYPHHNVYWITSVGWDLRALQAILRSTFVYNQIRAVSVQMRGGAVRYQAQVLRKLRIPLAASLPAELVIRLVAVARSSNQAEIDAVAAEAFNP